jgi:Amt family ammonium transporter
MWNATPTADELQAELDVLNGETDTLWIMISAFLVFFMQAGFAMLEMGTVRSKNAQNILIKNLLDVSIATILWFVIG